MSSAKLENSRPNFTLYPLFWLAVSFALGIFVASQIHLDWKIYLVSSIVLASLAFAFHRKSFSIVFILLSYISIGGFYQEFLTQNEAPNSIKNLFALNELVSGDPVEIEGILQGKPEVSVGSFSLILNAEKIFYKGKEFETIGKLRLFAEIKDEQIQAEYDNLAFRYGTKIRVATRLNREERYLNLGSVSYLEILEQKGIYATASIKSPLLVERLGDSHYFSPFGWVLDYRQDLINSIQAKFNLSTSGILIASMLGNRSFLTQETADIFRDGGTFHVLVISGLHITFIGGILLFIVRIFTRKRLLQFFITASALWIYSFAVGAEIPVVRAALMLTILLFSFVIYRRGTLLNALGFCVLLILVWRPEDIFSPSFHLTFASLFGIICVAFPMLERLREIGGWMPSAETPFPPIIHKKIRVFCETLYWSEKKWEKQLKENIWDCTIFKSNYCKRLEEKGLQKTLRWIFEGILVTTIVQIFLLPFLVIYFHRISFVSVLLNLWVGIFVVLQNLTAIVALIFAQISDIFALPIIKLTELFNWFLLIVPQILIENNFASIRVPIYSGNMKVIYLLYFIPILILTVYLNKWNPFFNREEKPFVNGRKLIIFHLCLFLSFFILIVFHPYSSPAADGKLTVDFLDVGQGDSALVTFPNGEIMLIDGGGKFNFNQKFIVKEDGEKEVFERDAQGVGETVVSEFLWEKGYSKVDYLLASHADADHIQGLINVANNFEIKTAFIGRENSSDQDFVEFSKILKHKNVPIVNLSQGDLFSIGGTKIDVINPFLQVAQDEISSNNDSVVVRIAFGTKEFLFTGDIEKETEKLLLTNSPILESDVVKVAHHGSRSSSTKEFIAVTKAKYAVIPVGRKSPFGHPHKEVVERWENSGAKVITTGEKGTVTISTDGKILEIRSFIE